MLTTIQISSELRDRIARLKKHPRQPYEEVVAVAIELLEAQQGLPVSTAAPKKARRLDAIRERFGIGSTEPAGKPGAKGPA